MVQITKYLGAHKFAVHDFSLFRKQASRGSQWIAWNKRSQFVQKKFIGASLFAKQLC